jgi:molybdopterin-guanine dinucleotide biosynthesis protein A
MCHQSGRMAAPLTTVQGAVLAGGDSRRYGGVPKGLLTVGGRRILDRVVEALARATGGPPLLIANALEATHWRGDLLVVPDVQPGAGSLGGILTALVTARAPVLCVAWDMPFVPAGLLRALAEQGAGFDAFLPESSGPRRVEPLCAVYGPACIPVIERQLARGDLRAVAFHADVRVGVLPLSAVRAYGDPALLFFNVNAPDDLGQAEDLWRRSVEAR